MEDFSLYVPLITVLAATWRMATPIIFAAIGAMFSEKAGVLNIGLEGIMLIGAFSGFAAAVHGAPIFVAFVFALLVGAVAGAIFGYLTVYLKTNQIVVGAAFNLLGLGITGFLYRVGDFGSSGIKISNPISIPFLADIPFVGPILFQHTPMVYLTLPLVFMAFFVLYRTAYGLNLRAAGDYPNALAAAGQSVNLHRFSAVVLGCSIVSVGGAFLTLSYTNQFVEGIVSGRGFMALAVIVFGRWTPLGIFGASLLFGLFFALQLFLQTISDAAIPYQAFQAMPYVLTIVVLVLVGGRSNAPKFLTVPFQR
ncbi:MAG: ABC transporter permease [Rhodobacteraceae bacterium]|nr:ABC transporter permease [Paracoccaceae bacterium]